MSIFSKVALFARSPQGQQALRKAKGAMNDPKNRAKVDQLVGKVKDRAGKGGSNRGTDQNRGQLQGGAPAGPTPGSTSTGPTAGSTSTGQDLPVLDGTVVSETRDEQPPRGATTP